jgi:GntR family transcriptional regulator
MPRTGTGYEEVADDLRARIADGTYPPGSFLPRGDQLADQYGVAVLTIRRAVRELTAEGLVTPIRGHGTFVRNPNPLRLPLTRHTQLAEGMGPFETAARASGRRGVTELLAVDRVPADSVVAQELRIKKGDVVVRRRTQMRIDQQIIQIQHAYLPTSVADGTPLAEHDKLVGGMYPALRAASHQLVDAVEVVTGRMPTREEIKALKLSRGAPVLEIRRTTRSAAGVHVVHTKTLVNADHAHLVYQQAL